MDFWTRIFYYITLLLLTSSNSTWETSIKNEDDNLYKLTSSTNDSPGLQYEVVGKAKLYKSSWTINTYFDLKNLDNSFNINKAMLKSIKMYVNISDTAKVSILRLKKHELALEKEIDVIKQLAEHNKRVKRSFEFGGSALQWMFGIADADDVRRYDSSINKMEKNQDKILRIVHDQISILSSTIYNFNDTVTSFNENKIVFDNNMKRVEDNLNNFSNELSKEKKLIFDIELINLIENNIFELDMFITRLQRMISNAQMNKVDPFVMTPYQLLSEIKNIENILPDDLKLPVKFNLENIHEVFKIMSVQLHYINDKLIFLIKIPLCIVDNFNLFHILPIYVPINEYGQFLHMTESPMYLLADEMVTKYFVWPNLNNCIVVAKIFVCAFNEMIHNGESDPICVTQLLKNSAVTLPPQCETYITEFKKEMWYPSYFKNNWYFVCEKPTTITIICNKQTKIFKIKIKNSGKLYLKSECFAFTTKGVLRTEQSLESSLPVILPIDLSILNDSCCNMPINQSYPKPIHLNEIKNLKFNKDAFNRINLQLDQQDNLITSLVVDRTYDFVYTNKYLILIIIAILIYCFFKYFKNKNKKSALENNIELGYRPCAQ
ncbi:uncharacterized protein LOC126552569 [Aphis gossypii]|uniref:uncharacterized protein LOC126552569 n=1 Tax=Aphis gossypii TaxID=80765 RepID=UPI002159673B|nr:uncharacterized protein LOC126552569 [Aphis gossypii]